MSVAGTKRGPSRASEFLKPLVRRNGKLESATWDEALDIIANTTKRFQAEQKALLLSPRLTNETAKAVKQLAGKFGRVGVSVAQNEAALCKVNGGPAVPASALDQLQDADAIIILGARPSRDNAVSWPPGSARRCVGAGQNC